MLASQRRELGVQRKRRLTIRLSRNRFVVPELPWNALGGFGLTHGVSAHVEGSRVHSADFCQPDC